MNSDIDVSTILSSQNDLRNVWQIRQMLDYVEAGGYFTQVDLTRYSIIKYDRDKPPLVTLTEFPDGVVMAHDGHHRLTAIYLAGRRLLRGDEYRIKNFTYPDYTEVNVSNGWMTPFDPITEIRLCEFGPFKREAKRLLSESPEQAESYILGNRHLYSAPRDINFIPELAEKIQMRLALDNSTTHGSDFCTAQRW